MTNSPDRPGKVLATAWQTRSVGDLSELAQARVEAINIAQWLVRIANSYVAGAAPERRTRLEFRPHDAAVVTAEFDEAVALEMRLPTLALQFLKDGKPVPHVFDPEEHSPAELEAWLLVELLHRGIDRERFSKTLPYAMTGLMTGDAEDYSPQLCRQGLTSLTALMRDAAAVLNAAASNQGGEGPAVACLPHNLNLVSSPVAAVDSGEFGFSPGDAENPEPHFYRRSGGSAAIKASTLMAARDPMAAALRLKDLTGG